MKLLVDTAVRTSDSFYLSTPYHLSITVAVRSKAWTVFARSNTATVGSSPSRGIDVCVHLFCVCGVLCADSGLVTGYGLIARPRSPTDCV
jgi:hypothetical protein